MTADRIIVTVLGLALIAFIVWFFWMKKTKGQRAATSSDGVQEAMVLVKGGYTPDVIVVAAGLPVRLRFRREESDPCSEIVQFPDFDKSAKLPTGEDVVIELLPDKPGEYGFSCQMGMFRGTLLVE